MRGTRLERPQPALAARTGDDGGFVLCDVPAQGSVFVSASTGSDTTDRIELVADRSGDATLRGRVGTADGDRPLPGASVLTGVPAGTRVALWTFQSVLDTVRVNAAALGDRSGSGFAARARSAGSGTFLDSTGIRRRGGVSASDVFRSLNGVRVDGAGIERSRVCRRSRHHGAARSHQRHRGLRGARGPGRVRAYALRLRRDRDLDAAKRRPPRVTRRARDTSASRERVSPSPRRAHGRARASPRRPRSR